MCMQQVKNLKNVTTKNMSRGMRNPAFGINEKNQGTDLLHSNCETEQHLKFSLHRIDLPQILNFKPLAWLLSDLVRKPLMTRHIFVSQQVYNLQNVSNKEYGNLLHVIQKRLQNSFFIYIRNAHPILSFSLI